MDLWVCTFGRRSGATNINEHSSCASPPFHHTFTFVKHKDTLVKQHADQFAPFRVFGCDLEQPFEGTIFRLPLRTPQVRFGHVLHVTGVCVCVCVYVVNVMGVYVVE